MTRTLEDVDQDLQKISDLAHDYSPVRYVLWKKLWEKLDELLEERWLFQRRNATLNSEVHDGNLEVL